MESSFIINSKESNKTKGRHLKMALSLLQKQIWSSNIGMGKYIFLRCKKNRVKL